MQRTYFNACNLHKNMLILHINNMIPYANHSSIVTLFPLRKMPTTVSSPWIRHQISYKLCVYTLLRKLLLSRILDLHTLNIVPHITSFFRSKRMRTPYCASTLHPQIIGVIELSPRSKKTIQ